MHCMIEKRRCNRIVMHAKNMKSASKKSTAGSSKKKHAKKSRRSKNSQKSGSSSSKKTAISTLGSSLPSAVVYYRGDDPILNTLVSKVVRDEIFPKKQFVLSEHELDAKSKVATRCLKELQMEESQWHVLKNLVRVRLNRKRNNAQLGVRRSLQRYMKVHGPDAVDLSKVLAGRKNKETFFWFLDEIATVVAGSVSVERINCTKLPVDWLSPSLEAFSLLCVENFFARVKSQVNNEDPVARAKWTEGRGCKKYQGWSQAGIVRYNELIDQVMDDRKNYKKVDEGYLKQKKEEKMKYESEKLRKKQEAGVKPDDIVLARDDFSSSDDSDTGSTGGSASEDEDESDSEMDE